MRHLMDIAQDELAFTMRGVAVMGKCGYEDGCPWAQVERGVRVKLESENSMTESVLVALVRFFGCSQEEEEEGT